MKCFTYADERMKKYTQESEYDTTLNYAPKAPIDHNYVLRGGNFRLQIIPSNCENFSLTKSFKACQSNLDGC